MKTTYAVALTALAGAAAMGGYLMLGKTADEAATAAPGAPIVTVALPAQLSEDAQIGKRAYEAKCAACHGVDAVGQEGVAPPLVHKIYEPGHHGDLSFQRAVKFGVKAHHWRFGDMAPVEGLTEGDVVMITRYVRELQRENGIF